MHTSLQGTFRKPTSIICNRYALLRRMFRKWVCRFIYSSVVTTGKQIRWYMSCHVRVSHLLMSSCIGGLQTLLGAKACIACARRTATMRWCGCWCWLTAARLWDAGRTTEDVHGPVQRVYTWRIDGPRFLQGCHGSPDKGETCGALCARCFLIFYFSTSV